MRRYFLTAILSLALGILVSLAILTYRDTVILNKDLTVEFNEKVKVSDFIYHLDGNLLEDKTIDTTKLGKNKIRYRYKNNYGWYKSKTFEINVIDTKKPLIFIGNSYTIYKGEDINLKDTIMCADEVSNKVKCNIEGSYNINKVGNYNLKITAIDESGNSTYKDFVLKVINKVENNDTNESYISFNSIYSKYKTKNTMIGLDISKWQKNVDFTELKKNGVEFVMLKLAGQTEIDGEILDDPYFYENIQKAKENNIKVGIYFYSYAKNVKEAKKQAKYVINALKEYDISMPIAFDWENWNEYNSFKLSFYNLNNIAQSFIKEIEKNGYKGVLYSSKSYLEDVWYASKYKVWVANYSDTKYDGDYIMWQLCSDGKIKGINGYVDIDVYYK